MCQKDINADAYRHFHVTKGLIPTAGNIGQYQDSVDVVAVSNFTKSDQLDMCLCGVYHSRSGTLGRNCCPMTDSLMCIDFSIGGKKSREVHTSEHRSDDKTGSSLQFELAK